MKHIFHICDTVCLKIVKIQRCQHRRIFKHTGHICDGGSVKAVVKIDVLQIQAFPEHIPAVSACSNAAVSGHKNFQVMGCAGRPGDDPAAFVCRHVKDF